MADLKCTMPGREVIQQHIPAKVTYRHPTSNSEEGYAMESYMACLLLSSEIMYCKAKNVGKNDSCGRGNQLRAQSAKKGIEKYYC